MSLNSDSSSTKTNCGSPWTVQNLEIMTHAASLESLLYISPHLAKVVMSFTPVNITWQGSMFRQPLLGITPSFHTSKYITSNGASALIVGYPTMSTALHGFLHIPGDKRPPVLGQNLPQRLGFLALSSKQASMISCNHNSSEDLGHNSGLHLSQ